MIGVSDKDLREGTGDLSRYEIVRSFVHRNGRKVNILMYFDEEEYSLGDEGKDMLWDFYVFKSVCLQGITDELVAECVGKMSAEARAGLSRKRQQENVIVELKKQKSQGLSLKIIRTFDKGPSPGFFKEKTKSIVGQYTQYMLTVEMPDFVQPRNFHLDVYIKIGRAYWEGDENLAIIYEKDYRQPRYKDIRTREQDVLLGLHAADVARYIVFPLYLNGGQANAFPGFIGRCLIHEMYHYTQIEFSLATLPAEDFLREAGEQGRLPAAAYWLFYCLVEVRKEAESNFADSPYTERKGYNLRDIQAYKRNLLKLATRQGTPDELEDYYYNKADLDSKRGNQDMGKLIELTICYGFALKKYLEKNSRLSREKILASAAHPKDIRDIVGRLFHDAVKAVREQEIRGTGMMIFGKDGREYALSELSIILKRDRFFNQGPIPPQLYQEILAKTRGIGVLSLLKLYEEACALLGVDKKHQVLDTETFMSSWQACLQVKDVMNMTGDQAKYLAIEKLRPFMFS